jgi:endonuclease YncB( thermonuclease family)
MRLLRIPFAIVGIIAACGGWLTLGERLGRPERAVATSQPPDYDDPVAATFTLCDGPVRTTCVVDGDTFWFRGDKIRIADIDAPEISEPECSSEREVGELSRSRLLALLNAGSFTLTAGSRDTDRYGRKLRRVWRSGESLGVRLVEEGFARRWDGPDIDWCQG